MIDEFTKGRFKALVLISQYLKCPSRELILESIYSDIKQEDLRWVTERFHYYTLRLLEDVGEKNLEKVFLNRGDGNVCTAIPSLPNRLQLLII